MSHLSAALEHGARSTRVTGLIPIRAFAEEVDSRILVGLFQPRISCDSVVHCGPQKSSAPAKQGVGGCAASAARNSAKLAGKNSRESEGFWKL